MNQDAAQPVWAGIAAADVNWPDTAAVWDDARAAGGEPAATADLAALVRFPDARAAALWLVNTLRARPDALTGGLAADDSVTGAPQVAARFAGTLGAATAGTVVLRPGLATPAPLRNVPGGDGDPDTLRHLALPPAGQGAETVAEAPDDPDAATRLVAPGSNSSPGAEPGVTKAFSGGAAEGDPTEGASDGAPAGQTLQPGAVLSHTYAIAARLARGGMGTVYLGRHVDFGSRHAIKVISPEHGADQHVTALFRKEAESLRRVRHDAVVAYDGTIRDSAGRLYLIMEYADGPSLAQVLRDAPLSEAEAARLARRIGNGLDAAHDKGIVHRDVSPDNIVLVDNDVDAAKIIDFGIARNMDAAAKTVIGSAFAGKYTYASPEQLGLFGGDVDRRSDIYSMGLTLAAALGKPLDMGQTPAEAARRRAALPDLSAFPAPWAERLAAMLQPDPGDRPQRFAEVPGLAPQTAPGTDPARQTTGFAGTGAPARGEPARNAPARRRGTGRLVAAGLVILLLAGGAGAVWTFRDRLALNTLPRVGGERAEAPAEGRASPTAPPSETATQTPSADGASSDAAPARPPRGRIRAELESALPEPGGGHVRTALAGDGDGYRVTLRGVVGETATADRLRERAAGVAGVAGTASELAVRPPPFCRMAAAVAPFAGGAGPDMALNAADGVYRNGEAITVTLTAQGNSQRHVYASYLDAEGIVMHLLPNPARPDNTLDPGARIELGGGGAGPRYRAAPPHGHNLLVVVSSDTPLFDTMRRSVETAAAYLEALRKAMQRARAREGSLSARTRFIRTKP